MLVCLLSMMGVGGFSEPVNTGWVNQQDPIRQQYDAYVKLLEEQWRANATAATNAACSGEECRRSRRLSSSSSSSSSSTAAASSFGKGWGDAVSWAEAAAAAAAEGPEASRRLSARLASQAAAAALPLRAAPPLRQARSDGHRQQWRVHTGGARE